MTVYIVITAYFVGLIIEAIIIGVTFFVLLGKKSINRSKLLFLIPIIYFSVKEYISYKIFTALEMKITIGNAEAVQLFGRDFIDFTVWKFDYIDLIIAVLQSLIVYYTAYVLSQKYAIKDIKP
jgi:hypothetical protein